MSEWLDDSEDSATTDNESDDSQDDPSKLADSGLSSAENDEGVEYESGGEVSIGGPLEPAIIVVRLILKRDYDALLRFLSEEGGWIIRSSAGNRGLFVRISIPDAVAEKLSEIGFARSTTFWRVVDEEMRGP